MLLDRTDAVCMLAGIAAVGVIYHSQQKGRVAQFRSTECSARRAATLTPHGDASARVAPTTIDEEQDDTYAGLPKTNARSPTQITNLVNSLHDAPDPQLNTRSIGAQSLIPGRCFASQPQIKIALTDSCAHTFNMSPAVEAMLLLSTQ